MAMNKQRRTANLNNIVTYDTSKNVTLLADLTIEGLTGAGFVKTDINGLLSVDAGAYLPFPSQTGNGGKFLKTDGANLSWDAVTTLYTGDGTLTSDRTVNSGGFSLTLNPTLIQGATFRGYISKSIVSGYGTTTSFNNILASDADVTYTGSAFTDLYGAYHSAYITNSGSAGNNLVRGRGYYAELAIRGQTTSSLISLIGYDSYVVRRDSSDISTNSNNTIYGNSILVGHVFSSDVSIYTSIVSANNNNITNNSGTMNIAYGNLQNITLSTTSNSKNSLVSNYYAFYSQSTIGRASGPTGAVTNYYGLYLNTPVVGATGTITNRWGIYAPDPIMPHYLNGNLLLGTVSDTGLYKLDVQGTVRVAGAIRNTGTDENIVIHILNESQSVGYRSVLVGRTQGTVSGVGVGFSVQSAGGVSIGATVTSGNGVSIGNSSVTTGGATLGLGSTSLDGVSVGTAAVSNFQGIAIGNSVRAVATSSSTNAIAIGNFSYSVDATFVSGSSVRPITDVYFGSGITNLRGDLVQTTAAGASYTINGSGAFGTDFAGGNITIAGGKGTGAGTSGDVIISTATPTSTGTTLQTLTQRVWVKGDNGNVGIGASPNASYKLDVQGAGRFTGDFQFGSSVYAGNVVGFKQTTSPSAGSAYYYMYCAGDLQRTGLQIEHRSDWPSGLMVGTTTNNISLYGVGAPQLTFNGGPLKVYFGSGANIIGNWGVVALPTNANTFTITTRIQDYHNFSYLTSGSFLIGGNSGSANGNVKNYFFGGGADLAGNTQTERSVTFYATFPDSQTDSPGGNFIITGGRGTGTGTPGDVIFSTATPTSSGTTLQTLTQRMWVKGNNGNVGIGASPDAAYKLDVAGTGRFTNILSVITTGTTNDVALFKATEPYITIEAAGASNSASIFFRPSTAAQNATIQNRTGGGIEFYTGATPSLAATITAANNLLVGTTADQGYRVQITGSGDNMLSVWGATAPSIRIDNAATGATQRFVLGLATATSNFITGAVAGDICMTTQSSSPLLFGANATEVMRITTTNNLLIGTTTDAGYRLDVNGTARVSGDAVINEIKVTRNGTPSGNYCTYIGNSSWGATTLVYNTFVGGAISVGAGNRNVGIGSAVTITGTANVAIGHNAVASGSAIAIGGSTWALANTLVFGSTNYVIYDVYFGSGVQRSSDGANVNGASASVSLNATGAAGTDFAGGNMTIAGGKGTGSGTSGDVVISTASTTTSGTTLQTLTQRLRIKGTQGSVRFIPIATPASAEAGDVYYDSTSNKLRCYNGTTWNDLF